MAVRKRREATIREVTDFVSADRLRHTESCMHRQYLRCLHYLKNFFPSVMFLTFIVHR